MQESLLKHSITLGYLGLPDRLNDNKKKKLNVINVKCSKCNTAHEKLPQRIRLSTGVFTSQSNIFLNPE